MPRVKVNTRGTAIKREKKNVSLKRRGMEISQGTVSFFNAGIVKEIVLVECCVEYEMGFFWDVS